MSTGNELTGIRRLVETLAGNQLPLAANGCKPSRILKAWECIHEQIISGWKMAVFSDRTDDSLQRYFSFQLEVIRQLSDNLFELQLEVMADDSYTALQEKVLFSLDYLLIFFPRHIDRAATAPLAYSQNFLDELKPQSEQLYSIVGQADPGGLFQKSVKAYLAQMSDGSSRRYTFQELLYFKNFIAVLLPHCNTAGKKAPDFLELLVAINFNHLQVFTAARSLWLDKLAACQTSAEKLTQLFELKKTLSPAPVNADAYSVAWPHLTLMLTKWLDEEIAAMETCARISLPEAALPGPGKLALDLSVAHLAAIIRIMVKEGLLKTTPLAEIFGFAARHLRTRRQGVISAGSLSKEYYSISQVTAATILDKLTKMASRVNRDFFPVFLGAGIIVHDFLKSR